MSSEVDVLITASTEDQRRGPRRARAAISSRLGGYKLMSVARIRSYFACEPLFPCQPFVLKNEECQTLSAPFSTSIIDALVQIYDDVKQQGHTDHWNQMKGTKAL